MLNRTVPAAAEGMPGDTRTHRSYKAAFERLEAPISNLVLVSKTQRALLDGIFPGCEAQPVTAVQNEAICHVASLVFEAADELDTLWLDAHNEEGAPVIATNAAKPSEVQGEHRVSLFGREEGQDNLTAITDAVHAVQDLIRGLINTDTTAPNKQVIDSFWTGIAVVEAAMNDVSARLEGELDRRAGR